MKTMEVLRGNVLVLTVCSSLWRISVDIVWPFIALYVMSLGGRYETVGQVMAAGSLASMILFPLGGYIADFQGRIKVIAYMTYVYGVTFLIFVFTDSWEWVAVGMFAQSLVTFYMPAMQALMADSLPPGQRGIGFALTMAVPGAFGIASPLIGGWLIDAYGLKPAVKGLYLLGFLVSILVATIRLKMLKETMKRENAAQITLGGVPRLLADSYRSAFTVIREAPRRLLVLSALLSLTVFAVSLVSPFWIIRAKETVGLSTQQWGLIMLVKGLVNVLLSIPAGNFVDRHDKRRVAGFCIILGAVPTFLYLHASSFEHVLALAVFAILPNTFLNPALQTMFTDMVPREKRGRTIAALGGGGVWFMGNAWGNGLVAMLSATAGTLLSGYLYGVNSSLPWLILSVSLVALGVSFLVFVKEADRPEE